MTPVLSKDDYNDSKFLLKILGLNYLIDKESIAIGQGVSIENNKKHHLHHSSVTIFCRAILHSCPLSSSPIYHLPSIRPRVHFDVRQCAANVFDYFSVYWPMMQLPTLQQFVEHRALVPSAKMRRFELIQHLNPDIGTLWVCFVLAEQSWSTIPDNYFDLKCKILTILPRKIERKCLCASGLDIRINRPCAISLSS